MQSFDSTFHEADFMINTLKKLKDSNSKTSNNSSRPSNSVLQQPQQQQKQEKYSYPQQTQLHQQSPLSPHQPQHITATDVSSHPFPKSSLLKSSLLHCSIKQIPSQPPYCIFDDCHESRPNMPPPLDRGTSSLSTTALENIIIFSNESLQSTAASLSTALPSSCSKSNFNSINKQGSSVLHQYDCSTQHKKADKRPSSTYRRNKSSSTNYISNHFQPLLTTLSSPLKRKNTRDNCSSNHAALLATAPTNSLGSFANHDATAISPGSTSCNSASSSAPEVKFFNIHDKIKDLYLQLLAHDLHTFGENGIKHRTRSFILERLVEDEKLNTIVINLYPGNKGYALALHYDDRLTSQAVTASARAGDNFEISNYVITTTNAPSSHTSTSLSYASTATHKTASNRNNKPQYSLQQKSKTSGDDELNLIEVMHWPYEFDILLQCIDNEVIPDFLMDLLIAPTLKDASVPSQTYRKPNVFYSGCIICEIRDFRQTFGISTNSCDIKHVLLKPTNATIYTDIQNLIVTASLSVISSTASTPSYPVTISHLFRSPEDKLALESQIVLATAEPLCLDPDPNIGRFAINAQHQRQMFNTHELRRQMKKFSQISINRKRKIDQFMHSYGLELCDYLSRLRQRRGTRGGSDSSNTTSAADSSNNISVNNASSASTTSGNNFFSVLENAASSSTPESRAIFTKNTSNTLVLPASFISKLPRRSMIAYHKFDQDNRLPQETTDCQPQLIEERILETKREDNEGGSVIYHIKLSIFQRPSDSEYFGELYVDRDYRKGNRNGESCKFSLGTRNHANRYIQQFTEIFTEEGRKAVKITHCVPGHEPKVTHTGITQEQRHALLPQQLKQQQYALLGAQQQQQDQQFQQVGTLTIQTSQPRKLEQQLRQHVVMVGANGQQQRIIQTEVADNANIPNKAHIDIEYINNTRKNINIVDITSANASAEQQGLKQQQVNQFDDINGSTLQQQARNMVGAVSGTFIGNALATHCIHLHQVEATGNTTTHQLSPSNGSLTFVQQPQQAPQQQQLRQVQHASIRVQDKNILQQKPEQQLQKIQVVSAAHVNTASVTNSALRSQLTSSVPILQAKLNPVPISIHQQPTEQQQHILGQQQKTNAEKTTLHINQTINTIATNIMNSISGRSSSINTKQTTSADLKNFSNASILSLLNSDPGAMTSTRVASGTFTRSMGQQESVSLVHPPSPLQRQAQQVVTNDGFTQVITSQPQQQQRNQLLNSQLCKININSSNKANVGCRGAKTATFRTNTPGNIIAVNFNSSQDGTQAHQQKLVRVSVSALATQLSSPPAIMTNASNFDYTLSAAGSVGGGSVEILSNGVQQQQPVLANTLRHDSPASLLTHASAGGVRAYGNSSAIGVTASSLSSESNASCASGFAIPQVTATNSGSTNLNALLATVSPTPYGFDHSQSSTMYQSNHVFLEELNNSSANIVAITSVVANSGNAVSIPNISPHQKAQQQQFLTKSTK